MGWPGKATMRRWPWAPKQPCEAGITTLFFRCQNWGSKLVKFPKFTHITSRQWTWWDLTASHSPDALRTPAQWVGFTETRGHVLEPVPSFLPAPAATAAGVGDMIPPPSPLLPGCHWGINMLNFYSHLDFCCYCCSVARSCRTLWPHGW